MVVSRRTRYIFFVFYVEYSTLGISGEAANFPTTKCHGVEESGLSRQFINVFFFLFKALFNVINYWLLQSFDYLCFRPVKQSQKTAKRSIQLLTATQSEAFKNMRHKKDTRNCFILGLAVNKSGTLFLTDRNNKNIKSMSPDREVHQTAIPVSPVAFTFLDTTTAVAAGDDKKLYIFDIRDHTTLIRRHEHQLEYGILGMTNYNGNLVVTCATEPTCVKMIEPREPKWEELWVSKDKSGENLFEYPNGITTTSINGKGVIVVTDARKHSLTLLEAETGKFMKSQDVARKKPWGITVDNDGNVYVCYEQTSEICVWSNDLTKSKILLTVKDLILQPFYIVYNGENDSLYISYSSFHNKANTVDRFSLNKK